MDRRAEVERWLALRDREHVTYLKLSERSGIRANTLAHGARRLRRERPTQPEGPSFIGLVTTTAPANESGPRLEVIIRADRRVIVDASIDADTLTRVLTAVERC